jgi:hypothetical protein
MRRTFEQTIQSELTWQNRLNTTFEAAEVLRVSRRTVEELGKQHDRIRAESSPGEAPPSSPKFGLRRTWVSKRKHHYHGRDLLEYLTNCRREDDRLEPVHLVRD